MASRNFRKDRGSLEIGLIDLFAQVAIGSTGAPTLTTAKSKGIASIARNSAGKYTITLSDIYQYIVTANALIKVASGAPATSSSVQCILRADSVNSSTPTFAVEFVDNAGAAIELLSGTTVILHVILKNSTV